MATTTTETATVKPKQARSLYIKIPTKYKLASTLYIIVLFLWRSSTSCMIYTIISCITLLFICWICVQTCGFHEWWDMGDGSNRKYISFYILCERWYWMRKSSFNVFFLLLSHVRIRCDDCFCIEKPCMNRLNRYVWSYLLSRIQNLVK